MELARRGTILGAERAKDLIDSMMEARRIMCAGSGGLMGIWDGLRSDVFGAAFFRE